MSGLPILPLVSGQFNFGVAAHYIILQCSGRMHLISISLARGISKIVMKCFC